MSVTPRYTVWDAQTKNRVELLSQAHAREFQAADEAVATLERLCQQTRSEQKLLLWPIPPQLTSLDPPKPPLNPEIAVASPAADQPSASAVESRAAPAAPFELAMGLLRASLVGFYSVSADAQRTTVEAVLEVLRTGRLFDLLHAAPMDTNVKQVDMGRAEPCTWLHPCGRSGPQGACDAPIKTLLTLLSRPMSVDVAVRSACIEILLWLAIRVGSTASALTAVTVMMRSPVTAPEVKIGRACCHELGRLLASPMVTHIPLGSVNRKLRVLVGSGGAAVPWVPPSEPEQTTSSSSIETQAAVVAGASVASIPRGQPFADPGRADSSEMDVFALCLEPLSHGCHFFQLSGVAADSARNLKLCIYSDTGASCRHAEMVAAAKRGTQDQFSAEDKEWFRANRARIQSPQSLLYVGRNGTISSDSNESASADASGSQCVGLALDLDRSELISYVDGVATHSSTLPLAPPIYIGFVFPYRSTPPSPDRIVTLTRHAQPPLPPLPAIDALHAAAGAEPRLQLEACNGGLISMVPGGSPAQHSQAAPISSLFGGQPASGSSTSQSSFQASRSSIASPPQVLQRGPRGASEETTEGNVMSRPPCLSVIHTT